MDVTAVRGLKVRAKLRMPLAVDARSRAEHAIANRSVLYALGADRTHPIEVEALELPSPDSVPPEVVCPICRDCFWVPVV